jgi:hypothetical protein
MLINETNYVNKIYFIKIYPKYFRPNISVNQEISQGVIHCCLMPNFSAILWQDQVTFQWDDVHFLLDQHA